MSNCQDRLQFFSRETKPGQQPYARQRCEGQEEIGCKPSPQQGKRFKSGNCDARLRLQDQQHNSRYADVHWRLVISKWKNTQET